MLSSSSNFMVGVSAACCRQLNGKCAWKANKPLSDLMWDIATNANPGAKSLGPSSMEASVRVNPWLLWIVIAQAKANGSWVCERVFSVLFSQCAVTGIIGIQVGSIPSHPGVCGPRKQILGWFQSLTVITYQNSHCIGQIQLVISTGNPRVSSQWPIPVPYQNPYPPWGSG